MNNYIAKQKDIEILMQSDKELHYKLELLNESMKVIDLIEGNLISDNISISSNSDVRRTYSCELLVENSTFNIFFTVFFNYICPSNTTSKVIILENITVMLPYVMIVTVRHIIDLT